MKYFLSIILYLVVLLQCNGQDSMTIKLAPIVLPDAEMINNQHIYINAYHGRITIRYIDKGLRNGPQLQYVNKHNNGFSFGYLAYDINHRIYSTEIDLTEDLIGYVMLKKTEISNPYEGIAPYVNTTDNPWIKGYELKVLFFRKDDFGNTSVSLERIRSGSDFIMADGEVVEVLDQW